MVNSENGQNDGIDFDPNADYLKEVTERDAGNSLLAEGTVDPVFEQQIIQNVAESTQASPDPVVEAEIERVRGELGVGTATQEKKPDTEVMLQMMRDDRREYERLMALFNTAREQYDSAVAQYGLNDARTVDKKNQWDYVGRVKDEQGRKITSWMDDYPEHKEIFRVENTA